MENFTGWTHVAIRSLRSQLATMTAERDRLREALEDEPQRYIDAIQQELNYSNSHNGAFDYCEGLKRAWDIIADMPPAIESEDK